MIPHINDRLNNWAAWSEQRASGALGYPKAAAFTRLAAGGAGHFDGSMVINHDAWEIEQAVTALTDDMRAAAMAVYRVRGTTDQVCVLLHVSRSTLYRRIDALHQAVMDWLLDYYAERGHGQSERHLRRSVQASAA